MNPLPSQVRQRGKVNKSPTQPCNMYAGSGIGALPYPRIAFATDFKKYIDAVKLTMYKYLIPILR